MFRLMSLFNIGYKYLQVRNGNPATVLCRTARHYNKSTTSLYNQTFLNTNDDEIDTFSPGSDSSLIGSVLTLFAFMTALKEVRQFSKSILIVIFYLKLIHLFKTQLYQFSITV